MMQECEFWDEEEYRVRKVFDRIRLGGYVYVILCGPFVKIGHSADPESRLAAIQSCCPYPMELIKTVPARLRDEQQIHSALRQRGLDERGEWYLFDRVMPVVSCLIEDDLGGAIAAAAGEVMAA